jgi:hypothetical protein
MLSESVAVFFICLYVVYIFYMCLPPIYDSKTHWKQGIQKYNLANQNPLSPYSHSRLHTCISYSTLVSVISPTSGGQAGQMKIGTTSAELFMFSEFSRLPIQWIRGALTLRIKRPGCEADHSPQSSAEVKNAWSYTSTPPIRLHGAVLS